MALVKHGQSFKTMAITINGTGTLTGVSVGGLPDGIVDTDMLAANAVATAKIAAGAVTAAKRGTGAILQTVYGYTTTQVTNNTNTYADTGLTATITPSSASNKILILASLNCCQKNYATYFRVRCVRGSTEIAKIDDGAGYTNDSSNNIIGSICLSGQDSPNTTSATTYKLQFQSAANVSTTLVQVNQALSSILLLEVAG